ncbi:MAG: acyl-CoA thioesterase [Pseudomonadales bacterium]
MNFSDIDSVPTPTGELAIQTIAMPAHTNPRGDIFAGWLVSQMDLAAAVATLKISRGRVATVAIESMHFLTAVHVGAIVSCYTKVVEIGRTSVRVKVEVWINNKTTFEPLKVTEGDFVFVAIDDNGRTRPIGKTN